MEEGLSLSLLIELVMQQEVAAIKTKLIPRKLGAIALSYPPIVIDDSS